MIRFVSHIMNNPTRKPRALHWIRVVSIHFSDQGFNYPAPHIHGVFCALPVSIDSEFFGFDVDKSSGLEPGFDVIRGPQKSLFNFPDFMFVLLILPDWRILWHAFIVAKEKCARFNDLGPTSRFADAKNIFCKSRPLRVRYPRHNYSRLNQVQGPIEKFETCMQISSDEVTIWWSIPCIQRQVDAINRCGGKLLGYFDPPKAGATPNVH